MTQTSVHLTGLRNVTWRHSVPCLATPGQTSLYKDSASPRRIRVNDYILAGRAGRQAGPGSRRSRARRQSW